MMHLSLHKRLPIVLLLSLLALTGCKKPAASSGEEPKPTTYPEGLSWQPKEAKSSEPLEIFYKPTKKDALYGHSGDLYVHIGIVDGTWQYVPADWSTNLPKCKMTKVEDNLWSIKLTPTVRQWFGAPAKAILPQIGLVIRSADGKKQTADLSIPLADNAITHAPTQKIAMPTDAHLGINYTTDGVLLVLDAKDKNNQQGYHTSYVVSEALGGEKSIDTQMKLDPATGYFWYRIPANKLTRQDKFYYHLYGTQGSAMIADPYSEVVIWEEGIAHTQLQNGVPAYQWQYPLSERPQESQLMIYEMHLRDFTSEGNLQGALQKLDYISEMGFNAIELMPVQEFGGTDSWGYNPEYFFAMETAYGTPEQYKHFIDECHRRGMAVILDVVYNHATGQNPFAKLYWDSTNNRPANNNPWMNPQAPHRAETFFNDFNHESTRVVDHFKRNLTYLLQEYHIDGFRFDFTKGFTQKLTSDATPKDDSRIAILRGYYDHIKETDPTAYVIFEHFADHEEKTALANMGAMLWQGATYAYAQCAMGYEEQSDFGHIYALPTAVRPNSWIGYMESHDEERVAYKQKTWALDLIKQNPATMRLRLETNAAFFLLVPGPKMVWQYGEIGYDISINENGRTGRKPLILETPERTKLRHTYTRMLSLRANHPELWQGTFDWRVAGHWTDGRYITLTHGDKQLRVVGNFNALAPLHYIAPEGTTWHDAMTDTHQVVRDTIIAPGGYLLLTNF